MEIHSDSLILGILFASCIPRIFLTLITSIGLKAKSISKEASQMRKYLSEGMYSRVLDNKGTNLMLRLIGVISSIFILSLIVAILLIIYSLGKEVGFDRWAYWLVIAIPFVSSIPIGILLLIIGAKVFKVNK